MTRRLESKEFVEIACEVRVKTDRAVLIHDGRREAWIPHSQIEDPNPEDMDIGSHVTLLIHEWLAKDKGLI
jgi:hypothetical protein